jgi:hypothetical protein
MNRPLVSEATADGNSSKLQRWPAALVGDQTPGLFRHESPSKTAVPISRPLRSNAARPHSLEPSGFLWHLWLEDKTMLIGYLQHIIV